MPKITDPANREYKAGTEFDYAVWEPNTQVSLFNVPWDSMYRDVVRFGTDADDASKSRDKLNKFLDALPSPKLTMTGGSPVRVDIPVRIPLSHNKAMRYNYLRARNALIPSAANPLGDVTREYYYFILDVRYVNPNTTELTLQLDLFQTFIYDVEIGNSYVDQGHIGVANEEQMRNNGRDFLTVPESHDIGAEYRIVSTRQENILDGNRFYNVLVASSVDLQTSGGSYEDPNDPPRLNTAKGSDFTGIVSGAAYYVAGSSSVLQAFLDYWKEKSWITQGIMSLTLIPNISRYFPDFDYGNAIENGLPEVPSQYMPALQHSLWEDWRNDILNIESGFLPVVPERYKRFKKLLTYPYTVIELTTYTGTPLVLRPEAWNTQDATIVERAALIPPAQRVAFYPKNYNTIGYHNANPIDNDPGEFYDMMTQITTFPTVAIVNNAHIGYLSSNMNAMHQQYEAADWSQQRAMRGAQVGFDNTMTGVGASRQQTEAAQQYAGAQMLNQQGLERENLMYSALGGSLLGGAAGLAAGPVGGATGLASGMGGGLLGALTQGNTHAAQSRALGNQTNQAFRSTDISNTAAEQVANANRMMQEWGAKGDYEQSIAALDAKTRDARMLQPTTSGQTGGEFLHYLYGTLGVTARWKMIDYAAMATVCEHWLQFGYSVHRRTVPPKSLHVMSHFTYWRLTSTALRATFLPEGIKNAIRGIFEKGVTVWVDPEDIGFIDPAINTPKQGIKL